jgi:hypothetical protein
MIVVRGLGSTLILTEGLGGRSTFQPFLTLYIATKIVQEVYEKSSENKTVSGVSRLEMENRISTGVDSVIEMESRKNTVIIEEVKVNA